MGRKKRPSRHPRAAGGSWLRQRTCIDSSKESCFLLAVGEGESVGCGTNQDARPSWLAGGGEKAEAERLTVCRDGEADLRDLRGDIRTVSLPRTCP